MSCVDFCESFLVVLVGSRNCVRVHWVLSLSTRLRCLASFQLCSRDLCVGYFLSRVCGITKHSVVLSKCWGVLLRCCCVGGVFPLRTSWRAVSSSSVAAFSLSFVRSSARNSQKIQNAKFTCQNDHHRAQERSASDVYTHVSVVTVPVYPSLRQWK